MIDNHPHGKFISKWRSSAYGNQNFSCMGDQNQWVSDFVTQRLLNFCYTNLSKVKIGRRSFEDCPMASLEVEEYRMKQIVEE